VRFPEPLDYVLLGVALKVRGPDGSGLRGEVRVLDGETAWHFIPRDPWSSGTYSLVVHGRLEDAAGNNLYGLFDRPAASQRDQTRAKTVSRTFQVPALP
jgi:hypothetical protein